MPDEKESKEYSVNATIQSILQTVNVQESARGTKQKKKKKTSCGYERC